VVVVDIDDTVGQTYGYAKQVPGAGYTGIKGLNALLAVISTPLSVPLIAATRLRKGSTNSARGAAKLLAGALGTAQRAGAGGPDGQGLVLVRADSAFYGADIVAACRRAGARFSITARLKQVIARLIVRRVRHLNPKHVPAGQSEMFAVYRYHTVFTDSPEPMLAAEAVHRDHAIVEQVIGTMVYCCLKVSLSKSCRR
jgi:hypothetical protein